MKRDIDIVFSFQKLGPNTKFKPPKSPCSRDKINGQDNIYNILTNKYMPNIFVSQNIPKAPDRNRKKIYQI